MANEILTREGFRWTALLGRLEEVAVDGVTHPVPAAEFQGKFRAAGRQSPAVCGKLRKFIDRLMAAPSISEVYLLSQGSLTVKDNLGGEHQAIAFSLLLKGVF